MQVCAVWRAQSFEGYGIGSASHGMAAVWILRQVMWGDGADFSLDKMLSKGSQLTRVKQESENL